MGRRRTRHLSLPPRMHKKGRAYYYVPSVGKRRWIPLGSNLAEAKRKWAELEGEPSEEGTINALLDYYERTVMPTLAEKTQYDKIHHIRRIREAFGHMPIDSLEKWHIQTYLDKRSAKVSGNHEVNTLSAAFSAATNAFRLNHNPCIGVRRNAKPSRTHYVTDEDFRAVRDNAPPMMQCLMDMAYMTGLRQADLLSLQWADVEPEGLRVQTKKTGRWVYIERTADIEECLERLRRLHSGEYLFCTPQGKPYQVGSVKAMWSRMMRSAVQRGIVSQRFTFHDIRAKCLTDAEAEGGLDRSMPLGGHSTEAQHRVYLRDKSPLRAKPVGKL